MGKLTDITNSANNAAYCAVHPYQRLSSSSDGVNTSSLHEKENNQRYKIFKIMLKRESPRFMSPTVASRAQVVSHQTDQPRTTIPKPESASSAKGRSWVASTAKQVGLGRADDGPSKSKNVSQESQGEAAYINKVPSLLEYEFLSSNNLYRCRAVRPVVNQ